MLFTFRGLFGIGMGSMWAAGMPLALEQWPAKFRGIASGILQGGSRRVPPVIAGPSARRPVGQRPARSAWRLMLWAGSFPATLIIFAMRRVRKARCGWRAGVARGLSGAAPPVAGAAVRLRPATGVTIHTSLLMGGVVFMYRSTTILVSEAPRRIQQQPLAFLLLLNTGGLTRSVAFGTLSEWWGGRRGAATIGMALGIASAPFYVSSATSRGLLTLGAWRLGFWRLVRGASFLFLSERFPTEARGVGTGFSYPVGVGIGSPAPELIGGLQDRGIALQTAMLRCIIAGGLSVIVLLWLGPETGGAGFLH